jgi:hypothetical protein
MRRSHLLPEEPGFCEDAGMTLDDISKVTSHSKALAQRYLDLIAPFHLPPSEKAGPFHPQEEMNTPTVEVR